MFTASSERPGINHSMNQVPGPWDMRHADGGTPNQRVNARVNAASSE